MHMLHDSCTATAVLRDAAATAGASCTTTECRMYTRSCTATAGLRDAATTVGASCTTTECRMHTRSCTATAVLYDAEAASLRKNAASSCSLADAATPPPS